MNKGNKNDHSAADIFSYMGLALEFLGVLALLTLIGYLLDLYVGDGQPGAFLVNGLALGIILGIIHLYRRARALMAAEAVRPKEKNREGYPEDLEARISRLRGGLDKVGEKIDDLSHIRGRHR